MILEIIINNEILEIYKKYYFQENPRRKKFPFDSPILTSLNKWMVMKRPQMNDLKQKWTNFSSWLTCHYGFKDLKIKDCDIEVEYFFKDKRRRDPDNYTPKNVMDGFTKSGLLEDDSFFYVRSLKIMYGGIDKLNPRTIFRFIERG